MACAGLSIAAPVSLAQIKPREVSSEFLNQITLYAQYAAATYVTENTNSPNSKITCPAGNCPLVEAADTTTLTEFEYIEEFGDVAGFLAVDRTNEEIVLSFRGTASVETWIANLNFEQTQVNDICDGCEAHAGFMRSWGSVANVTMDSVQNAMQTNPGFKLIVTGHSFGGAMATIAATVLRQSGYVLDMFSYGAPRLGNMAFAEYVSAQGSNFRVTHTNDMVPRVPPRMLGYRQTSPEYWITTGDNTPVGTADIVMINEADSDQGNTGQTIQSVMAHRWYTGCMFLC
ncbi:Alpha/Beta hydrolase protein [Aspergillus coremiiformis]|uniref:feruloyl esterase n=1 Tax=Aspergillus coremiiformis TaxID=138285 RepID=A0A5N6ZHM0_9EURO|nr:Alpha/Beta hydrolase protein [Aspergillus coremiiformis]